MAALNSARGLRPVPNIAEDGDRQEPLPGKQPIGRKSEDQGC